MLEYENSRFSSTFQALSAGMWYRIGSGFGFVFGANGFQHADNARINEVITAAAANFDLLTFLSFQFMRISLDFHLLKNH